LDKTPSIAKSGLDEVQSPACPFISFEKHSFRHVFGYLQVMDLLFEGGGVGSGLVEIGTNASNQRTGVIEFVVGCR
jgi:hypothetical protein